MGAPGPVMGALVAQRTSAEFKTAPIFEEIKAKIEEDGASYVKKIGGIIGFVVKDGPGCKSWDGSVELDSGTKADCTLTMKDDDLYDLMLGKINPNSAFFSGKLKISGNMGLAMKINSVMPAKPKL